MDAPRTNRPTLDALRHMPVSDVIALPAEHLARQGEGLLLMSLGVEDLSAGLARLAGVGITPSGPERTGLRGWRIQDLATDPFNGVQIQLCEPGSR